MFNFGKPKETTQHQPRSTLRQNSPSVVSADMFVLGNIASDGFIDLEGKVDGNVKCKEVIIRTHGIVNGDVVADAIQIFGSVRGLVKAKNITLHSSAKVEGVIMHESLSVEDGAFVDGKFKRMDKVFIDDDMGEDDIDLIDQIMAEEESDDGFENDDEDSIRLIHSEIKV